MTNHITLHPVDKTLSPESLTALVAEANQHHRALKELLTKSLDHARAAGDALIKIKAALPHGEFSTWVSANCEFSDRTARRYMTIAENWDRLEINRTRVRNLSVRGAVKFLTDEAKAAREKKNSQHPTDISLEPLGQLYDWEPQPGEVRLGELPDYRLVVLQRHEDIRFIKVAVIVLSDRDDGAHVEYTKRGINRNCLDWWLAQNRIDIEQVQWWNGSDHDWIVPIAFPAPEWIRGCET